ncbi:MAG: histone deacetylase [Ignavibacteriales bacterium]|nr:histone deacetylase [Ignavibacteriales bacterium]
MNTVGFFYHPHYLKHLTGPGHPERPERLSYLVQHLLKRPVWNSLVHLQPQHARTEHVMLAHPEQYITEVARACSSGITMLDQDTRICRDSYDVALLAVGAVVEAVEQVVKGKLTSAFCAVRPPGHHAETARAMGFCLFNNAAIAAKYARKSLGVNRVAIVDWDVHHGNGTQEIFYQDPTVLYISLHQYPFYPGTGSETETGNSDGKGLTLNCPMKAGSGEEEYLQAFNTKILPTIGNFKPELLIISAGFDAHRNDPLAGINLTEETFGTMTSLLKDVAEKHTGGKIVSVLEGGYDLNATAKSVEIHLDRMIGRSGA